MAQTFSILTERRCPSTEQIQLLPTTVEALERRLSILYPNMESPGTSAL